MKFVVPLIGQNKTVTVNLTVDPDTALVHGNRTDALPMCGAEPPRIMAGIERPDRITCEACIEARDVEKVSERLRK